MTEGQLEVTERVNVSPPPSHLSRSKTTLPRVSRCYAVTVQYDILSSNFFSFFPFTMSMVSHFESSFLQLPFLDDPDPSLFTGYPQTLTRRFMYSLGI